MRVCHCSMFSCTLLYVHSSFAIILMGKRKLVALLNLSSWCLVMVERLFLVVPRGCLQFVIVVFFNHTHILFLNIDNRWRSVVFATNVRSKRTLSFYLYQPSHPCILPPNQLPTYLFILKTGFIFVLRFKRGKDLYHSGFYCQSLNRILAQTFGHKCFRIGNKIRPDKILDFIQIQTV